MKQKFIKVTPAGDVSWIEMDLDSRFLEDLYDHLDCDSIEIVYCNGFPDLRMIIDECGKLKGLPVNLVASEFYSGWSWGDPICGSAIFYLANGPDLCGVDIFFDLFFCFLSGRASRYLGVGGEES